MTGLKIANPRLFCILFLPIPNFFSEKKCTMAAFSWLAFVMSLLLCFSGGVIFLAHPFNKLKKWVTCGFQIELIIFFSGFASLFLPLVWKCAWEITLEGTISNYITKMRLFASVCLPIRRHSLLGQRVSIRWLVFGASSLDMQLSS